MYPDRVAVAGRRAPRWQDRSSGLTRFWRMPLDTLTVAIAQADTPAGLDAGLARAEALAAAAAARGADLLAFPETWLPGYPAWLDVCPGAALWDHAPAKAAFRQMHDGAVTVPGPATEALSATAARHGLALVVGVIERVDAGPGRGTLFNAILTFGPDGALLNHHRKLVPTYTERLVWGPGDADGLRSVAVEARGGGVYRLGSLVCWEHWMPLARQAMHDAGEDVHVALWPTVHDRHMLASRHYAVEGRTFVLACGAILRAEALPDGLEADPERLEAGLALRGGSVVVGPDGVPLSEAVWDEERLVVETLDLRRVREEAMALDVTGHYARPDLLSMTVQRGTRRGAE